MASSQSPTRNLLGWCLVIICLWLALGIIGCQITQPLSLPYPPGFTPPTNRVLANVPLTVRRAIVSQPPTVTFTCDIGAGTFDGCNIYESTQPGNLTLLRQFGPTNVFPVILSTNWPHFIELRTFINWPAPYVVTCVTNDDSSVDCQTNTYYESGQVSDFLWVPAGMTNQWLAAMPDGTMELIGYGVRGTAYSIKHGSLNGVWQALTNFMGTNGPWIVPVTRTNSADFFVTTRSN